LSKRVRRSLDLRFLILWIVAGIFEFPALAMMSGWPLPLPWHVGFVMHCVSAALVFLAPPPERGYFRPTRHWGESLGLISLLVPGAGWAAAGWLVLDNAKAPYDKDAYIFHDEMDDDANPTAAMGEQQTIAVAMADAHDVIPAVDALLSGSSALKRGAIETLARIQTAEAIGWIQKARSESDPEVRFYATTALTRLKHEFETAIHAAEREVFAAPSEIPPQISLQRVRYEYAVSGMLEGDASTTLLEECRKRLTPLAQRYEDAARMLSLVEKKLAPERAFAVLDRLEDFAPERRSRWVRERAELLFSLGRAHEVKTLLSAHRAELQSAGESYPEDREWRTAFLWWADD